VETTRHEKRFQVNALSRRAFQKALNSCFGGELLMLACLAPTLELDAKSIILRQPLTKAVKTTGIERSVM